MRFRSSERKLLTFGDDEEVVGDDTELVEEDLVVLRGILDKEGRVVGEEGVDTFNLLVGLCLDHWWDSLWLLCQCWCVTYFELCCQGKKAEGRVKIQVFESQLVNALR